MIDEAGDECPAIPRAGEILDGKYVVEEVLGAGAMGIVLAARHVRLGHSVAVKLLAPSPTLHPNARARLRREARLLATMQSEHVVRVFDYGALEDGAPYVVMERLWGTDLQAEMTARGPLPIAEAVGYVVEACTGLSEAHARGVVHRDIKPSNLFLTRRVDSSVIVKLVDFGVSKMPSMGDGALSLTDAKTMVGSPMYMAPEQIKQAKDVDGRADLWSLGIVLFGALTGTSPFTGEALPSVCAAIVTDEPIALTSLRPDAPRALEEVILRCLAKDPAGRYSSAAELAEALAPFASRGALERHSGLDSAMNRAGGFFARASRDPRVRWLMPAASLLLGLATTLIVARVTASLSASSGMASNRPVAAAIAAVPKAPAEPTAQATSSSKLISPALRARCAPPAAQAKAHAP